MDVIVDICRVMDVVVDVSSIMHNLCDIGCIVNDNRIMNESRIAYILPVVGAVLGFLFTAGKATGERILSAFLLALMLFIVAWVMNRRSRMLKYRKYRVKKIVKANPHLL